MVTGVDLASGASVQADLVVDASGRRSALPEWFAQAGLRVPVEERQDCGFFYLTRYYSVNAGVETPLSKIPASVALDYATVFALGADNDTFSLTSRCPSTIRTVGAHTTRPIRRLPPRGAAFCAMDSGGRADQRHLDDVKDREPATSHHHERRTDRRRSRRHRRRRTAHQPDARSRHLDGVDARPTPRRGRRTPHPMTLSASSTASAVDRRPPRRLVRHPGRRGRRHLSNDSLPGSSGSASRPPETPAARFAAAAFLCARHDEVVGIAVAKMAHLFPSPADAFGEPDVAAESTRSSQPDRLSNAAPTRRARHAFEALATA